jgi:serine phosphatase RsbU (regulator of sigma subunit)
MSLGEDDGVLLYTDGILDARDGAGARFGEARLSALVAEYGDASAEGVVEHLRRALADFTPAAGDDVCLLAARHRSSADWRPDAAPVGSGRAG